MRPWSAGKRRNVLNFCERLRIEARCSDPFLIEQSQSLIRIPDQDGVSKQWQPLTRGNFLAEIHYVIRMLAQHSR